MKSQVASVAERFTVYHDLGWLGKWWFRHYLQWVSNDEYSVQLLLDFEKRIRKETLSSRQISQIIVHALTWYNQEDHDERIKNRLPHDRTSDLLQIVLFFLEKRQELDYSYRDLFIKIIDAIEDFGRQGSNVSKIRPDQFRFEVMDLFSNLTSRWGNWYPSQSIYVDHILAYLRDIANKANDIKMFTLFRLEAQKEIFHGSLYQIERVLDPLRDIADKVVDEQTFTRVFSDFVPKIGLGPTSGLMRSSANLQEFESNFRRVSGVVEQWSNDYISLFNHIENTVELEQLLGFLNSLTNHARMTRYIRYVQFHQQDELAKLISGSLSLHKHHVYGACHKDDWKRSPEINLIQEGLIDGFEQYIVNTYLNSTWHTYIIARKLHWEFSKFTEYIPYEMRNRDWTEDNEKNRSYWNTDNAKHLEYNHYIQQLEPRLCSVLRKLKLADFEILLALLPGGFLVQEFTKEVDVPVEWEQGVEYQEGYNKWAGNYTEEIIVARPKAYAKHVFTFERPDVQKTITLLDDMEKIHHAIQKHRKSLS